MNSTVDMTYSFLSDEEPTEEQLQVIMEEVAEDARRENEEIRKQIKDKLESEYLRLLESRGKTDVTI